MSEDSKDNTKEAADASDSTSTTSGSADLKTRIIGGVIDMAVIMAIYIVGFVLALIAGMIADVLVTLVTLVLLVVVLAYSLLKDAFPFLDGQSIGKKMMGIRAVAEDGKHLTGNWGASALRNIVMIIWPVELIILAVRQGKPEEGRRLGDDLAKTRVVKG